MLRRADARKYHIIYKTTCKITGRWYIGRHSTDDLCDGYIGSGTRLWHSINKHGKENHVWEILEFLPDRKSLSDREKELVNAETLKKDGCMNLREGGDGGNSGDYVIGKEAFSAIVSETNRKVHAARSLERKKEITAKRLLTLASKSEEEKARIKKNRKKNSGYRESAENKVLRGNNISKALKLVWKIEFENKDPVVTDDLRKWCGDNSVKYSVLHKTTRTKKFYKGMRLQKCSQL